MGLLDLFKKKDNSRQQQEADFKDINPLDVNSIIDVYKAKKPNATEADVLNFVKQLAAPDKDQEHLTSDGDLPWGWHTTHAEEVGKIGGKYHKQWKIWYDSREKSPAEYLPALEQFVNCMISIKKQCAEKGECYNYWRDELFTDGYLDERSKELTEIKQNIAELESSYQAKQEFEKSILPTLEKSLMQIIKSEPGILQKDVYKMFPQEAKSYIQEKLYCAEKSSKIVREKSGNSYKLYTK